MSNPKPGEVFYWIKLKSLDNWDGSNQLICKSLAASWYEPTQMVVDTKGRYFREEDCYQTSAQAKESMKEWINKQRTMLDEIEAELNQ